MCYLCLSKVDWQVKCAFQKCHKSCNIMTGGFVVYFGFKGERYSCSEDHFLHDKVSLPCFNNNCDKKCKDRDKFLHINNIMSYQSPFSCYVATCSDECKLEANKILISRTSCCICYDNISETVRCLFCETCYYCSENCYKRGCGDKMVNECEAIMIKRKSLQKLCDSCGVDGSKYICSKCEKANYCSTECQKIDWKRHYKTCGEQRKNEN